MKKIHTPTTELKNMKLNSQALIIGIVQEIDIKKRVVVIKDLQGTITIPLTKSRLKEIVEDFIIDKPIEVKVRIDRNDPLSLHIMRISQDES